MVHMWPKEVLLALLTFLFIKEYKAFEIWPWMDLLRGIINLIEQVKLNESIKYSFHNGQNLMCLST